MMGKRQRCGWKKIGFQWFLIIFTFNFTLWSTVFAHPGQQAFLDYGDALAKCLVYFESQRSGRLPYNQRVTWRDHSGLTDGLEQGVDLVGGYYDAGDNVKFGLPMAFTVTMLSWSVIEYRQEMKAADEYNINHALEAIKWGTDYFIKAHTEPNVLWAQVGDGETDHYCWQRPEDMKTSRQAYKINPENPGSDLAGETAAAMAAASMVFKESNPHYSHLLLHHAQELFEFADKYRGKYDNSISVAKGYYPSVSGYKDELLWAALWLYHATNKDDYLNYAVSNGHSFGGTEWAIAEFSWDVKYAGVQILATKVLLLEEKHKAAEYSTVLEEYLSKAEYYLCSCLHKNNASNNINFTPGGLLYIRQWNNMQYVSNAAFLLIVYSDYLKKSMSGYKAGLNCEGEEGGRLVVDPEEMLCFAKYQADYMLGLNPMGMSYLVGFGSNFPLHVHHRGASIVSHKENQAFIGCTQGFDYWYKRREPNPNVLVGAIVGGPDSHDNFRDDRENYMQTEACTYNTAPMVGVFAKLYDLNK